MGREAATGAAPLARHSFGASLLRWSGSPCKHSQFQASSLPPRRRSPHRQQQPGPQVCSPNPVSQAPAPVCIGEHTPRPGHTDCGLRTACAGLPRSSCVDRLLRSPPIAPEGPLLSPLTLLAVKGTSQAREHLLIFIFCPRAHVPFCCFSSSFSLLASYPIRQGSFLCFQKSDVLCQCSAVLSEKCFVCRCILDAFMGRDELHVLPQPFISSPAFITYHMVSGYFVVQFNSIPLRLRVVKFLPKRLPGQTLHDFQVFIIPCFKRVACFQKTVLLFQ